MEVPSWIGGGKRNLLSGVAVGAKYALIDGNADQVLQSAIGSDDVTLVEVLV